MRISCWSSDVCSSHLRTIHLGRPAQAHFNPNFALVDGRFQALSRGVLEEINGGGLVVVVVVALHFQLGEHPHGIFVGPVRELEPVLAISAYGVGLPWFNDNGAVNSGGLLHTRMRVIQLTAALLAVTFIGKRFLWGDDRKTYAWPAYHFKKHG